MGIINGSHWGAFEAETSEGRIISVSPIRNDPSPSPILDGIAEAVHHDCRIQEPVVREGWLRHRDKARGGDSFIQVSWDDALDMVAGELQRIKAEYGNEAIFAGSYGWASAGRFHHAKTQLQRFLNCFGGFTGQKHNYSIAAGLAILPYIVGDMRPLRNPTSWSSIAESTDLIVAFGGIGIRNTQVEPGGTGAHTTEDWLRKIAQRGTKFVSITPLRSDTPEFVSPEWIGPRPNTDVALMMGLAHTLVSEERLDRDFLANYTTGADRFLVYLLGEIDGQPKTADWASGICDIPADTIRQLAARMASNRTMITTSYSLQRGDHGEQTFWMTMVLACILGQIGMPGGGFGFGYGSMHGQGNPAPEMPNIAFSPGRNPTGSFIPVARIADLLHQPGEAYDFDGERRIYPATRLIYWCGGNPFHHHQDLNRLLDGWRKPDTVIVHEPWWTPTAKLADIVLPATTTLERNDIGASSRDRFIIAMKQVLPPQFNARNDFDIFCGLAERMGIEEEFSKGRDEDAWLRHLYASAHHQNSLSDSAMPDFDSFWEQEVLEFEEPALPYIVYEDFRLNPTDNPLPTPSGKFEIFSEVIEGFGYNDCPGHPVWQEPAEWLGSGATKNWPLHMISNQPKHKLHAQLDFVGPSLAAKRRGHEIVLLSLRDAKMRNISDGDVVRIFNSRGATLAVAAPNDGIRDGVLQLPTGAWFDPQDWSTSGSLERHGNPNVLTLDKGTSCLGQGPISHTTLVEIEKYVDGSIVPQPYLVPTIS